MVDLMLIAVLGFLGSFGHCVGMCGPVVTAFSLAHGSDRTQAQIGTWERIRFQLMLSLGRLLSYGIVGGGIGALGSVLIAGGQMAGIGSTLRQGVTFATGLMLILLGLRQIAPQLLPKLPFLHPLAAAGWHERLHRAMDRLARRPTPLTPLGLGMAWGLIPCGFLYTAQIRAAETGSFGAGFLTLLAFGLGTVPMMLGIGISTSLISAQRRSQLFRAGGWITLIMGILLLLRTDAMVDLTGHGSLLCLGLALIARPIGRIWGGPLRYRRLLGVTAFGLGAAHLGHMLDHSFDWNLSALSFLPWGQRLGLLAGVMALGLMLPAALTSFDRLQRDWGSLWRRIHLLSLPALGLAVAHTLVTGSHYGGALDPSRATWIASILLILLTVAAVLIRCRWVWSVFHLESWYVPVRSEGSPQDRHSGGPGSTDPSSTQLRPHHQGG